MMNTPRKIYTCVYRGIWYALWYTTPRNITIKWKPCFSNVLTSSTNWLHSKEMKLTLSSRTKETEEFFKSAF